MFVPEKFLVQKNLVPNKFWKILGQKKFWVQKFFLSTNFWVPKYFAFQKILRPQKFGVPNICGPKSLGLENVGPEKFWV